MPSRPHRHCPVSIGFRSDRSALAVTAGPPPTVPLAHNFVAAPTCTPPLSMHRVKRSKMVIPFSLQCARPKPRLYAPLHRLYIVGATVPSARVAYLGAIPPWADRCLYPWVEAPSWRSSLKRHWGVPRHHFLCGASTVPVNSGHCPAPPPPPRASHHHYSPLRTPSQRRWPVVWATIAKFPSPIIAIVEISIRWVPSSLNPSIRFTASPSPSSHHPRRSLSSACWQRPGLRHAVRCGGAPLSPFGLLAWDRLAHLAGLARSQPRRQAGWPGLARQHSALPFSHSINLNDSNRFQT
jgi:hypothetical protein